MPLNVHIFMAVEATLSYVPGIFLRYSPFASKITAKRKKLLLLIYSAIVLMNMTFLFLGLKDYNTATKLIRLDILLIQIVLVITNIIVIRGYFREHIFTFGVSSTCMYILLSISSYLPHFFKGVNESYQYLIGSAIYIVISIVCYPVIQSLLKKTVSPFLSKDCNDYWKSVWFIPLLLYISMFLALPIEQSIETLSLLFSRFFIGFCVIVFSAVVAVNHRNLMEKQALADQLNMSKVHYASLQSKVEASRKINHDLKHIITAIRHYIDTNDKSGLGELCCTIEDEVLSHNNVPYTGNSAVDGVLYHYIKKAEENNINFQFRGHIAQKAISDIDICVLLGNALENAFTGCLTVPEKRSIIVTAETDETTLSVVVQNTFDGKVQTLSDTIVSRKREDRVGVRLKSMQTICEKYSGSLKTKWNDNTFTVLLVMSLY